MSNQKLLGHVYLIQVCLQLGSSNINALYFFQIRILPWTGAKAEADSLKVELELKSERNQELQKRLNQATQNIEKIARERDSLQNSLQKAESEEEKVKNAVVKDSEKFFPKLDPQIYGLNSFLLKISVMMYHNEDFRLCPRETKGIPCISKLYWFV